MGHEIQKWTDAAMVSAAPMQKDELGTVKPKVYLLSATPDPLGALAAGFRMYKGDPTYDLRSLSAEDRVWAWEESLKTHLKAPWEFIDLHFFIEGVTRSFTHQMVRQRTACFAQESLRFAVKENLADEIPLPPMVVNGGEGPVAIWQEAVKNMEKAYLALVNAGIPAEDARGLLPHATTTRLNYKTTFRALLEHAGNRLCTQAQFEWRAVFLGIIQAIRDYRPPLQDPGGPVRTYRPGLANGGSDETEYYKTRDLKSTAWQFKVLALPLAQTFSPVCYKAGRCTFMGTIDRACSIRDRVQAFAEHGVKPEQWNEQHEIEGGRYLPPIMPDEWMSDPTAGITYDEAQRPS